MMTVEEFQNFYNRNVSALRGYEKFKIIGVKKDPLDDGTISYQFNTNADVGFGVFTNQNSNKITSVFVGTEISDAKKFDSRNYLMSMVFASQTFCNEKFITNQDDLNEGIRLIKNLVNRAQSKDVDEVFTEVDSNGVSEGDAKIFYNGRELYFLSVTDKYKNISALVIKD